jgi:SagB-type dehydrogenase family enzyme
VSARRAIRALAAVIAAAVVAGCTGAAVSDLPTESRPPWPHDSLLLLPPPDLLDGALLTESIARRGSVRDFSTEPLSWPQISALLWAAQGLVEPGGSRTVPSAGALYPLEVYVVTDDAVLHYVPDTASVEIRRTEDGTRLLQEATRDTPASFAPAIVVITGVPSRVTGKYRERGIPYMWLEAGHAAQNLLLATAAMGLGAVTIGAFDDDTVAEALGLSDAERPLYLIPVGPLA